jgi:UDP-sugar transporter A1/2/3
LTTLCSPHPLEHTRFLQVTYQLKIFTTAVFSITMLGMKISYEQWVALFMLAAGVATVQIGAQKGKVAVEIEGQSTVVGLVAVIAACCTSGFAGVYFEKILKGTKQSVWLRNIQLALFSIILGTCGAFYNDGEKVRRLLYARARVCGRVGTSLLSNTLHSTTSRSL